MSDDRYPAPGEVTVEPIAAEGVVMIRHTTRTRITERISLKPDDAIELAGELLAAAHLVTQPAGSDPTPAGLAQTLRKMADALDDVDCPKCGATAEDGFKCKPGEDCPVR